MTELKNRNTELLDEDSLDEEDNDEEKYEPRSFQYDPDKINIATRQPTIEQLLRRIDEEALDLAPEFQRQANIWKPEVQSRLIESILIRIPLPAFYIDATDDDNWLVVDGLQRLSALKKFVTNKTLKLTELEYLTNLEGKTYDELEPRYRRRILETQPTVYLIEQGTPPEVKYNIFKRINTGGTSLSNQEIRHALNPGQATKFLAKLAASQEFTQVVNLGNSKKQRMDDREFILGFLAFKLISYEKYQDGERDSFLSAALFKINHLTEEELNDLEISFKKAMITALQIFGKNAFRKLSQKTQKKQPLNKALFEAWSVNISNLTDAQIRELINKRLELIDKFMDYTDNDQDFFKAISQAANKVEYRFKTIEKIIREVLS